jgi:hypothetical protein
MAEANTDLDTGREKLKRKPRNEVEKSDKTKNLTTEGTVNWKIWQKVTENQ